MSSDTDPLPVAVRNLRRAAVACLLLTLVMVGQCSAFGVQTARGPSYVAVAADPTRPSRMNGLESTRHLNSSLHWLSTTVSPVTSYCLSPISLGSCAICYMYAGDARC